MTGSCSGGVLFGVHCFCEGASLGIAFDSNGVMYFYGAGNKIWQIALSWL